MENSKVDIIPYLPFHGNCEEAVHTYIDAFGGEVRYLSRWSKSAGDIPSEWIGKVMHAEFLLGKTPMSAGDSFDGEEIDPGIRLMVHLDSEAEALRTISILAQGGKVLSPLAPHPAPDDGGCGSATKDRFGFTWIVTCPNPAKKQNG